MENDLPPLDEEQARPFDEIQVEKELPFIIKMGFLFLTFSLSAMLGFGIIQLLGAAFDFDFMPMLHDEKTFDTAGGRNTIRGSLLINHIMTFVVPSLVFCWFFYRSNWRKFLKLIKSPDSRNITIGTLFMVAVMPVAQLAIWLNKKIPLPDWARTMEDQTTELVARMLTADSHYEFFINLLVVAILPALGEELLFRGVIQQEIQKSSKNGILAIWVTAFFFSAFHMQFEGFFARMILGAALGYLFYWTKNLCVPIIAHFLNNGLQVVAAHFYIDDLEKMQEQAADQSPIAAGLVSIVIVFMLGRYLMNYNRQKEV